MSEEGSAYITARLGIIVRVLEEAYQNTTRLEAQKALKKLKAGTTSGLGGLATECLKM